MKIRRRRPQSTFRRFTFVLYENGEIVRHNNSKQTSSFDYLHDLVSGRRGGSYGYKIFIIRKLEITIRARCRRSSLSGYLNTPNLRPYIYYKAVFFAENYFQIQKH